MNLKPLIENQQHTNDVNTKGNAQSQKERGAGSGREQRARERNNSVFGNSTDTHIENKKGNCPSKKANSSCTDHHKVISEKWLLRNTFE